MRDWNEGHMDNGWGLAMALGMFGLLLVLVAVVVVAVVWASRTTHAASAPPPATTSGQGSDSSGGARAILDERLARGEIEPEEYRARLEALTAGGSARA
jgi:putative membrane protein